MTTTSACRSTNRPNNSALLISLRTRSIQTRPIRSGLAGIHENRRGMFEVVPDRLDERRPHVTIDYAVVEGARQVHHFPNRDLVVSDDGPLLDLVHREDGLGEEREEGEFDSLALRGGFQMVAQVNELGHVDLFHIREVSRGGVRFRHLLEDPLPQPMDRDPLFAGGGRDCSGRYGHRGGDSPGGLSGLADVIFGEATLRATASDCREIHVEFLREAADGGWRGGGPGPGGGRGGGRGWRWRRGASG